MSTEPLFETTVERDRNEAVVHLRGELDLSTVARLDECLQDLIADGCIHLVLEMSGLEFVDSTGLATVVHARNTVLDAQGWLAVDQVPPKVRRVFELTGLQTILVGRDQVVAKPAG